MTLNTFNQYWRLCLKCQSQNCSNFAKKKHAHLQYAAKFQNECLKTLRGVDYTILLSLTETESEKHLSQKCHNFVENDFLAC